MSLTREAFCVIRTDASCRVQRHNPMQQFPDDRCVRGDELGSLGLDLDPDFNTLQGPFLQWSCESAMQIKLVLKRNGLYSLSFYRLY